MKTFENIGLESSYRSNEEPIPVQNIDENGIAEQEGFEILVDRAS
jgi:hypothetical protein